MPKTSQLTLLMVAIFLCTAGSLDRASVEWRYYGGDPAGSKYSPLAQINKSNVSRLEIAWEWKAHEEALEKSPTSPDRFETTPLMIDNVLYITTGYDRVAALDAQDGHTLWTYDPKPYDDENFRFSAWIHRGVAAWSDGPRLRLFYNTKYHLICLDAKTGVPVPTFGDNGKVELARGLTWNMNTRHHQTTSPPVIYKNLVIVGHVVRDENSNYRADPPGDVRAFDVRTGKMAWTFHTIPAQGEVGSETWEDESWKYTGHCNSWAPMTLDETRGLLYVPISTPSSDFYGGRRPGANLYGESLVCLDVVTGSRKWHYQIVHHGLWDYDLPSPPNLLTITVQGKKLDAVVQLTKMGLVFVFDRVTGKPVWPIEEKTVPPSDVAGEKSWPTQPFPTKPPAISPQGVTLEDAFDLTPELRAAAQAEMKKYRLGPLYTPPTLRGTLMLPGLEGGANWGGGAVDPETGWLYVKTSNTPHIARPRLPDDSAPGSRPPPSVSDSIRRGPSTSFMNGLPLLKPPYGNLTAIDLNRGEIAWRETFGDTPEIRSHPALEDVPLPAQLGVHGPAGVMVTKGGLVFAGGGDRAFHAIDKTSGRELWRIPLLYRTNSTPMTYQTSSGRQFVIIATGTRKEATLVAFALKK